MPGGAVRLRPELGLDNVQAKQRAALRGMGQRGVVVHPQVALEPDNRVRHRLFQAKRTRLSGHRPTSSACRSGRDATVVAFISRCAAKPTPACQRKRPISPHAHAG